MFTDRTLMTGPGMFLLIGGEIGGLVVLLVGAAMPR
jgi:hypothetical protein